MILTFVTLTNDASRVPVWECSEDKRGNRFAFFIRTDAVSKKIMVLGPKNPSYVVSAVAEVQPNVFISKLEIPYTDFCVAGDDLRPFIEGYDMKASHKNVVVLLMDRESFGYLDSATGRSAKDSTASDSVIVNTFNTKEWIGCIAVLGTEFERGNYNPSRMVGMYLDYVVNGAPRSSMLHEMCIKGNPKGISITDGIVDDGDIAKKLLAIHRDQKKHSFRIKTIQRLTNYVVVSETEENVDEIFKSSPADYLSNPYDIEIFRVPVDEDGNVIENDYVKNELIKLFEKDTTRKNPNKNCSVVFYNCRPSSTFFTVNLRYIFVANKPTKKRPVSYLSLICP